MAITPSDYARKCNVTIAHTFGSAQTGFVAVLTENSLPAEIFTTALNGGGDIVICSDENGTTRLPIEVVKFDTVAQEAVIWVRMPTADTASVLWLFYGKSGESQPAVDALYGRNQVWVDYNLRISCDDSLGAVDSTGLRTYSDIGNVTRGVSGKFTKAYSLINAGLTTSNPNYDFSQGYSISYWANLADMPKNGLFFMRMGNNFNISRNNGSELIIRHGGNLLVLNMQPSFYEVGTMSRYEFKWNNVTGDGFILKNGQLEKTFNFSVLPTNTTTATFFYETSTVNSDWNSIEALSFKSYVSEEYSSAEHANQSSPATFWSVGTPSDTVGGGTVTTVTATYDASFDFLEAVTASHSLAFDLRESVTRSYSTVFDIRGLTTNVYTVAFDFNGSVSNLYSIDVDFRESVSINQGINLNFRETVSYSQDVSFNLRERVSTFKEVAFNLREQVSAYKDITFDFLETVSNTLTNLYNIGFDLRETKTQTHDIEVDLRETIQQTQDVTFSFRELVSQTIDVTFNLFGLITNTISTAFDFRETITQYHDVSLTFFGDMDWNAPAHRITFTFNQTPVLLSFSDQRPII